MKPMLAAKCTDITKLKYPVLASIKLDGVRCLIINGRLMSRMLKEIPNHKVQELFAGHCAGLDGELIVGDPTAEDAYRKTVSAVMGDGNDITGLRYYIFDNFKLDGGFEQRFNFLKRGYTAKASPVQVLSHVLCNNVDELNEFEANAVDEGHEGVMVRSLAGPYKQGRSTEKEGYLLKVKRFEDGEATVIGFEEYMHNENEAETNALGHTERSSKQEGLVGAGVLGKLVVTGLGGKYDGVEFGIGTGFQGAAAPGGERHKLWKARKALIGKITKYKFFPLGSKDRPRFPVFLGWRDPIDL